MAGRTPQGPMPNSAQRCAVAVGPQRMLPRTPHLYHLTSHRARVCYLRYRRSDEISGEKSVPRPPEPRSRFLSGCGGTDGTEQPRNAAIAPNSGVIGPLRRGRPSPTADARAILTIQPCERVPGRYTGFLDYVYSHEENLTQQHVFDYAAFLYSVLPNTIRVKVYIYGKTHCRRQPLANQCVKA